VERHYLSKRRRSQKSKVIDQEVSLPDYQGPVRQLLITDLGHEEPAVLLTNDLKGPRTPCGKSRVGRWCAPVPVW
jgi:hypothetical protein